MGTLSLPHDAKAGPTKSEVRAVLVQKLDLGPADHVAEVGSCTGAVTIEAARRAGRASPRRRPSPAAASTTPRRPATTRP